MKARVPKKDHGPKELRFTGAGPYHGHPIRLTIGMIVKNEEKTLDRCLASLRPLMEAVESELIVTDTGSTDRTVEIAQKYTDHIIHFEWCNDFSAARNTGLKEARGEWFLFLDGDEWFEDTSGLIEFFTSGECDQYGSASYLVRNYFDFEGNRYNDFHALRMFRMYDGIHFRNAIHEDIVRMVPTKFLSDYVHHYGYVFHNEQEKMDKSRRNMQLLEQELKEDPLNLKAYYELSRQYFDTQDLDKVKHCCELGLQTEKEYPNRIWRLSILHNLARALYEGKAYRELLELVEELARADSKSEIIWMDFYFYAQNAAFRIGEFERSASHGRAYLQVYEQYWAGQLDQNMLLFSDFNFIQPGYKEQVLRLLAQTYLLLRDDERAWEVINQLDLSDLSSLNSALLLVSRFCQRTENWARFSEFYRKVCSGTGFSRLKVLKGMEAALPADEKSKDFAVQAIAAIPDESDVYIRLNRLRKAERENSRAAAACELDWFFRWDGDWDPIFSDVLFCSMKERINPMPAILKIDVDDLRFYTDNMQRQHSDFVEVIREHTCSFFYENAKGLFWSICLQERVLLTRSKKYFETKEDELQFFEEYARLCAQYTRMLYRPELLSSDQISILPRAHRFGYYMGQAFIARKKENHTEYLANLRLALQYYPVMKLQITLLLEQFEQEEELRRKKAEEFSRLAKQVKERIRELLAQGKVKEAGQVTMQLAALMPNDPDVVRFRTLTHTEPDMNELASRLPQ